MNILIASSECVPFAKTGGLADVVSAVAKALPDLGHEVAVVMPYYRRAAECGLPIEDTGLRLAVPVGAGTVMGEVHQSRLNGADVPVYLIRQPDYFDRDGLYDHYGDGFGDNAERFIFFSRSVLETVRALKAPVDVIHVNDWQTGLVSTLLDQLYRTDPLFERTGTLCTIHNIAYQGRFWHWDMELTGLDWKLFNWRQLEFHGHLNLLKAGLVFSDLINTVSPTYAREIQTPEFSYGLDGVLKSRSDDLYGILNGVDYSEWSPDVDPALPCRYTAESVGDGKLACKRHLQERFGLPASDGPLVGLVTRLQEAKGLDLVAMAAPGIMDQGAQIVLLGTGDGKYHDLFSRWNTEHGGRFAAHLAFDDELAHQILAGADMFLMPSRFEPCGLTQLYSLKYGTAPIVRATGGLADTIVDAAPTALAAGRATGFSFVGYDAHSLYETVCRALTTFEDPALWRQVVRSCMRQDFSWSRSAGEYVKLYEEIVRRRRTAASR